MRSLCSRPEPIDGLNGPWPLHDAASTRRVEQAAVAGAPTLALMDHAGFAVARLTLALAPHAQRVHIWAGPGNNGGDGLVAAGHLLRAGRQVRVDLIADPGRQPADAAAALQRAVAEGVPVWHRGAGAAPPGTQAQEADFVIDALLGLGLRTALQGELAEAVARINRSPAPVLAVDLPSGLHPDTGQRLGEEAVRADATLSLLTLKPGCFTADGRDHAGRVWLDTLGGASSPPTAWLGSKPAPKARLHGTHKGSFGDVAVAGGAHGMTGAAWLAARAALAAGAGRVHVVLLDPQAPAWDPLRPELMAAADLRRWPPDRLASTTVACGCGGGDRIGALLPLLLARVQRMVLDADALNAIAADAGLQSQLRRRRALGLATLLTPHPLEAARLLNTTTPAVQADRLAAAAALADRFDCCILLKGSGTVIAAAGGLPWINPTGNAALATAGTGDVLAGYVAGCWAQQPGADLQTLARHAAWAHGRAADLWPASAYGRPLRAADLVERLALSTGD
jgi:hydroxyethylthiazole kinase-like uncharacterized protein yjeF